VKNNLEFCIPCPYKFSLHISIINSDGNVYDLIAHLISNLFSGELTKENEHSLRRYIKLKKKFSTNTFCLIDDKLLIDPTSDEVYSSNFYFSLIKFENEEFIIHKIKGDSANWSYIKSAFSL
jgi:exosome complex RNA-binding protein Rrp42 (RNase PH superfamily)